VRILISGAGGLVGKAITPRLLAAGHAVRALARRGGVPNSITWDVATGDLDKPAVEAWGTPDAVIHLAGENIAVARWSPEQKRRIVESRVEATRKLAAELIKWKPKLFIGASAVGIYGSRGDEILNEQSPGGTGFLPDVCEAWEKATERLVIAGVKVVHLRFGLILSGEEGALARMLPIFRAGFGGKLGSGKQWMSWIALEDVVRVMEFCLAARALTGAFNTVAPNPVRNADFTAELGRALKRPAVLPVPALALRLLYGEMADALLLSSQRVIPERLEKAGFEFEYPRLSEALAATVYKN
jgi:uncharacterized protein (TIGR01777 family)